MNTQDLESLLEHPSVQDKEVNVFRYGDTDIIERVDVLFGDRWIPFENDEIHDELDLLYQTESTYVGLEGMWRE